MKASFLRKYASYVWLSGLVILGTLVLVLARTGLERQGENHPLPQREQDLYLPEPAYLKFMALGHDLLVADLVLAKAMTYYGSHYQEKGTFPYRHLQKLFFTAVEMDPQNTEAILLAGNILSNVDVRAAIDILKKGMVYHPQYWKFPEMIGYIYSFRLDDSYQAGVYYERAARLPGHPPYVPSLSSKFFRESGRYEEAIRVLYNFYSTTTDRRLKASFKESILELQEAIKKGEYQCRALVFEVLSPAEIRILPDTKNPHFRFLKSRETLCLEGMNVYSAQSSDPWQPLFARWQFEHTRQQLVGAVVQVDFIRDPQGGLKRDEQNRLYGTIIMKNQQPFKLLEFNNWPPSPITLDHQTFSRSMGRVIALRFVVRQLQFSSEALYLHSASAYPRAFSVVIPRDQQSQFVPKGQQERDYFSRLTGQLVEVTGFIDYQNQRFQMTLYSPLQLVMVGQPAPASHGKKP